MELTWILARLEELTPSQVHDLFRLRVDTFVVEQRCAYPELDGRDPDCTHLLAMDPDGRLVACGRIVPPADDGMPHLGRIVVHPAMRGHGIAHELMRKALEAVGAIYGHTRCALAAQSQLEAFYAEHGFVRSGPDYDWDGIPHVDMIRER
ncbi:MAG: GNAT family N-acetyltransferase [Flavobacteriales bacterium]